MYSRQYSFDSKLIGLALESAHLLSSSELTMQIFAVNKYHSEVDIV